MKKQNNIFINASLWASFILTSILFNACIEEDLAPKNEEIIEGVPVEVNLNLDVPAMQKVTTRGLSDEEEFQVNGLYIFVFDANSKEKKDGTGYYEEIIDAFTGSQNGKTSTGKIELHTTSGASLLYGIANVGGNDLGGDFKDELDKINTLEQLKAFTVRLSSEGNVDRITATLVMSGAYESTSGSSITEKGYCIIPAKNNTLNGTIKLTRLDSHISFKIRPLMQGESKEIDGETVKGKIISFTPKSWKVYNVPATSYLIGQEQDAMSNADDYATTNENMIKPSANNVYSFDFYMLENRKNSKEYNGETIRTYAQREEEEKTTQGLNTGIYKFVESFATYVEIKAHIELAQEGTDNGRRIADVTYVVHLGYVDNDPTDFKSLRNKKYTYNISIVNVNSIVAEVTDGKESQPGAEGNVVDSKTKIYNIDCHYGYIILGFDYKEVKDGLNFYIKTPYGETTQNNVDEKNKHDYKWIKFKRNSGNKSNTLEKYPENGVGLIDLFDLGDDIRKRYQDEGKKDMYYYTVFIDEYYYEQHPCGAEVWKRPRWGEFTNTDNRYALLLFKPKYSNDKESSYAGAKFMITQKSIQTYYSNSETALGMEHENETGKPKYVKESMGNNPEYGYANIYPKWNNKSWNDYADVTMPSNNTFAMKSNESDAIYDCMSRNRDENADGKINGKEIKWYLPATQQLVGMFLGAESLTTPLFSDADKQPNFKNNKTEGTYHYITSNNQRIWGEEGASFGHAKVDYATLPEKLRCVRNLGVDPQKQVKNPNTNYVGKVFEYNESTRILRMSYMNTHSIRTSKAINAELGLHHNFSATNKPYSAFQVAKKIISTKGIDKYQPSKWKDMVKKDNWNRSVCANYHENPNESDKGTWRAPNQRELMLMYMLDKNLVVNKNGGSLGSYSRTAWKFNDKYHFGVNSDLMFMDRAGQGGAYIRCVRDYD